MIRLVALMSLTFLAVAGGVAAFRHLLEIDTFTKWRLERDGYQADVASVHRALAKRDTLALTRLKVIGVPLDEPDESGKTPFQKAVLAQRVDMLECLASLGVGVEFSLIEGKPVEVRALEAGSLVIADYLFSRGGDPNVEMAPGVPALVWAIREGNDKAFDLLVKHGASLHATTADGSPLAVALALEKKRAIEQLLKLGADPNGVNAKGQPLTVACLEQGRSDLTKKLINAGASPAKEGPNGESLLEAAFRLRSKEIFELCLRHGMSLEDARMGGVSLLESACEKGALAWVEILLKHRADPEQRSTRTGDPLWWTHLHEGRPAVSEVLLGAGANINGRLPDGKTPIEWAIEKREFRMTRYLFGQGAKAPGSTLWGPMKSKSYDVMRLLAAHGDDLNNPTSTGFTLLGFAVMSGDVTAAALLLEYGARYEAKDQPGGHRLLEWAIANRQAPMAELLLNNGADPNAQLSRPTPEFLAKFTENGSLSFRMKNDTRVTPIMLAAGSHQLDVAKLLISKGASRFKPTGDFTYPVTFAINSNDLPMAQLMLGREPELDGKHQRKIVVSIDEQRARLYKDGEVLFSTQCSTGKSGFRTPRGTFVITDKAKLRYSTLYGAAMPFFMRLSGSAVGMHQGNCPGYPASHGCIRLPYTYAKAFFGVAQVGDIIVVE
jgi:ankyrin repeat protein